MISIRTERVRTNVGLATAVVGALLFSGCGGTQENVEVQRKLVRAETTSTPRPEKGKPLAPRPAAKAVKSATSSKPTPSRKPGAPEKTVQSLSAQKVSPTPSPSPRKAMLLVTSHTLSEIDPHVAKDYRIEGNGLGTSRVYLRRYGVETELVPTMRSESLIEFARAEWLFLAPGAYDIVLRDTDGQELILPEGARVN
ncbi:MAG: hypothetical protein ACPL7D_06060 [Candidatus Sumerlaeaceae bacterium]